MLDNSRIHLFVNYPPSCPSGKLVHGERVPHGNQALFSVPGQFIWFANCGGGEVAFVLLSVVMIGVIYLSKTVLCVCGVVWCGVCVCVCVCVCGV